MSKRNIVLLGVLVFFSALTQVRCGSRTGVGYYDSQAPTTVQAGQAPMCLSNCAPPQSVLLDFQEKQITFSSANCTVQKALTLSTLQGFDIFYLEICGTAKKLKHVPFSLDWKKTGNELELAIDCSGGISDFSISKGTVGYLIAYLCKANASVTAKTLSDNRALSKVIFIYNSLYGDNQFVFTAWNETTGTWAIAWTNGYTTQFQRISSSSNIIGGILPMYGIGAEALLSAKDRWLILNPTQCKSISIQGAPVCDNIINLDINRPLFFSAGNNNFLLSNGTLHSTAKLIPESCSFGDLSASANHYYSGSQADDAIVFNDLYAAVAYRSAKYLFLDVFEASTGTTLSTFSLASDAMGGKMQFIKTNNNLELMGVYGNTYKVFSAVIPKL